MKTFYPIITLTCLLSATGLAGYAQTPGTCLPNQKSDVEANVGAKHLGDNLIGETQGIQSKCFAQKEVARFQAAALPVALPELATVRPKSGGSMTGQLTSLNQQELTISRNNASKSLPIAQVNNVKFNGDVWISSWAQTQNLQAEVERLLDQAIQQKQQYQHQEAIETFQQALDLARKIQARKLEATVLVGIGLVYDNIGQPQQALEYYNQAFPIFREVGDRFGEAATLNNIGLVYQGIGQPQQALEYYNQALPILREVGNRPIEATTLNNIGAVYRDIGQPQQALDYFNQALPILREVGDRPGEATTLNNIDEVYKVIGQQ
ncbi:MAG: tetratricopeptide repeat protein [Coleofasciculaceae cyanobacterium]